MNIEQIEKTMKKKFKKTLVITILVVSVIMFFRYGVYVSIICEFSPLILFFQIFVCILSFIAIYQIKNLKRDEKLAQELEHIIFYIAYNCILTDHYIIERYSKEKAVKYSNIVLMYTNWNSAGRDGRNKKLYLISNEGKKYGFTIDSTVIYLKSDEEPKDFSNIILEKNPDILVGKTKENKQILLEKYGIKVK